MKLGSVKLYFLFSLSIVFKFFFNNQVISATLEAPFQTVLNYIEKDCIYNINASALTESAINGILKNLDPYCRYLDPKTFLQWRYQSLGELGGIGVEVIVEEQGLRIITIYDDTPASSAFLKVGDLITKINNCSIIEKEKPDVTIALSGPIDSELILEIRRQQKIFDIKLQRKIIQIPALMWHTEQKIGYIRINIFDSRTESALNSALHQMKERLGSIQGLVLDLRNNGGGTLESAIQVSDSFLDKGDIVIVKGRNDQFIDCYKARAGDILQGAPMVVLINNESASASEIVAGALQDHGRAQIVGLPSYGKGIGQKMIPLENGGAIFLTTEQYYTPKRKKINGIGIQPDFVVPKCMNNVNYDNLINNEKEILKSGKHFDSIPMTFEKDYQLRRAIDVLRTQYFLSNNKL